MNSDMLIRITRYYRALNRLRAIGLEKVFAHNLADAAGVSAAVVRKDFSLLEIHGQKRGGYEITELIERLSVILGKGEAQDTVIIGCGRIGKALMHYSGFEPDGIRVVAGFDTDPVVYADASNPVPVYGILNFSPITLKPRPAASGENPVVIHNINIALELEQIFYELQFPMVRK